MDDLQATLQERGKTHGDFRENSKIAEGCIAIFEASTNWSRLTDSMRQTLRMDVHKIGRILSGNPFEPDHWRDKAGYNTLIVNQLNETATQAKTVDALHGMVKQPSDAERAANFEAGLDDLEKVATLYTAGQAPEVTPEVAAAEARSSIEKDEGQRTDLRDGGTTEPSTFIYQVVRKGGVSYYNVARTQYKEEETSHLTRVPTSATHAEFTALPPYYRALYHNSVNSEGRYTLDNFYRERWGK